MSTVIAARLVAPPLTVDARVIIHSLDGELEHLNQQFGTVLAINENIYDIRLADDNEVQLSPENLDSVDGLPPATERPVLLVPTPEAEPAVRIIEALDRLHSTARGEGGGVAAVEMLCEVMKPFFAEHDEYLMQFRTDAVGRRERAIERHTLDGEERWAADELKRFEKLLGEQQSEEQILQDIIVTFLAEQYKGGVDLTYLQQRWAAEKAKAARVQTAVEEYEEARRREEGDHDGEDSADEDEKEASESAEVADEVAGIYGGLGGQQQQRLDDARALQKTLPSVKGTKFLTTCDLVVRNGLDEFSISALEEHAARVVQLGEDSSVTATRKGDEDLSLTFVVGDAAFAKTVWQWHRWASLGIVDQLLPEGLVVVRATASEPVMTRTRADDFDAIGCAFCKIIGDPRYHRRISVLSYANRRHARGWRRIKKLVIGACRTVYATGNRSTHQDMAQAYNDIVALLDEYALDLFHEGKRPSEALRDAWGPTLGTTPEVIYYAVAHAQIEGLLEPAEAAVAECAFGVISRVRGLLTAFNRRETGESIVAQIVHRIVIRAKMRAWALGI